MRLSPAQQDLVTEYYYIAKVTAKRKGSLRDPDEALSACGLGLCHAAYHWNPDRGVTFKNFAIRLCQQALVDEHRTKRFAVGRQSQAPRAIETNSFFLERLYESDPLNRLVCEECRMRVSHTLGILGEKPLAIMEMRLNGAETQAIADMLGKDVKSIQISLKRSILKLKRELER